MKFKIDKYSGIDLADQIRDAILGEITTGRLRAGEKLPTMQEIAKATKVTFRTARSVIERLAREGYVTSRAGIGTVVAPRRITVWRGRVLFVIREEDEASYHVQMVMGAVRRRLLEAGYLFASIVASRRQNGDRSQLKAMLGQTVDFAIVMYDSPYVETMFAEMGVPYVVACSEGASEKGAWHIPFSPDAAIAAFISQCRQKGVRRVTQVDLDDHRIGPMDAALDGAGIGNDHVQIRSRPALGRYAGIEIAALEAFSKYPRKNFPDVFLVWDTFVARGFFSALLRQGVSVPRDVAVVVQSNRGLGPVFTCPITRFEADGSAVGATVVDFVLAILDKGRVPKVPALASDYIIGETFAL